MGCSPSIITQSRSMASICSQSVSASTLFFNRNNRNLFFRFFIAHLEYLKDFRFVLPLSF